MTRDVVGGHGERAASVSGREGGHDQTAGATVTSAPTIGYDHPENETGRMGEGGVRLAKEDGAGGVNGLDAVRRASGMASRGRSGDRQEARQRVTEFIESYASSASSLASHLDELLHSIKDVPTDELEALVRRERRLWDEFVSERQGEFDRIAE